MFFGRKKKEEPENGGAAAVQATTPASVAATASNAAVGKAAGGEQSLGEAKHPHHVLGQITSLMAGSPVFQHAKLSDLSNLVIPAIRCNQIAIAEARDKSGNLVPVAAVVWANVSEDVDRRLVSQGSYPPRLNAEEWTSGAIPWVVLAVGSEKACQATIAQISQKQLGGRSIKINSEDASGKITVKELSSAA